MLKVMGIRRRVVRLVCGHTALGRSELLRAAHCTAGELDATLVSLIADGMIWETRRGRARYYRLRDQGEARGASAARVPAGAGEGDSARRAEQRPAGEGVVPAAEPAGPLVAAAGSVCGGSNAGGET